MFYCREDNFRLFEDIFYLLLILMLENVTCNFITCTRCHHPETKLALVMNSYKFLNHPKTLQLISTFNDQDIW